MNLDEFLLAYEGQTVGYPTNSSYYGECLSLVKWYMREVFGFNPPASGANAAYGYWTNFPAPLGDYFEKVKNTTEAVITPGCVPIWTSAVGGGAGHISVCAVGGKDKFISLDQNWNGKQAHMVEHNFSNIYGWLKPKETMSNVYKGLNLDDLESMKVAVDMWDRVINQKEFIERSDHEQILKQCQDKAAKDLTECQEELLKSNKQLSDKVTQLEKELSITRDDLVKKTNAYNEAKTSLMAQEDELNLNKRLWAELSGLPVATKDGVLRASDVIRGKLRDNPVEVDCFGILKENVIAFIKSLFKRK